MHSIIIIIIITTTTTTTDRTNSKKNSTSKGNLMLLIDDNVPTIFMLITFPVQLLINYYLIKSPTATPSNRN